MQTILGSGGAIGTLLAKELNKYTSQIRLVRRNPKKVNEKDALFSADLTRREQVIEAVKDSEIVYLTVGYPYNKKEWKDKWPITMKNVIDACLKYNCKLVFFDNMYLYDKNALAHQTENTPINPPSKKGEVRAIIVNMLIDAIKNKGLVALIARAPDFLGNHNSVVGETVLKNLKEGKKAMWLGNPDKIRNFISPLDAAKGTAILGNTASAYGQVWHLPSTKQKLTGKDWVQLMAQTLEVKPNYMQLNYSLLTLLGIFIPVMREMKEMYYQYNTDYYFDSTKFEETFNYIPMTEQECVLMAIKDK